MSERLQKSLAFSLLITVVATAAMYLWAHQIPVLVFATALFAVTFAIAYWTLFMPE